MKTLKRLRLSAISLALLVVLGAAPMAYAQEEDPTPASTPAAPTEKAAAHEVSEKPAPGDAPFKVLLEGAELGGIILVCILAALHDRHLRRQRLGTPE